MNPGDYRDLRKSCIRMSMETGTGLDYYLGLSLSQLIGTIKDFVEVVEEINEARRKAVKKKK